MMTGNPSRRHRVRATAERWVTIPLTLACGLAAAAAMQVPHAAVERHSATLTQIGDMTAIEQSLRYSSMEAAVDGHRDEPMNEVRSQFAHLRSVTSRVSDAVGAEQTRKVDERAEEFLAVVTASVDSAENPDPVENPDSEESPEHSEVGAHEGGEAPGEAAESEAHSDAHPASLTDAYDALVSATEELAARESRALDSARRTERGAQWTTLPLVLLSVVALIRRRERRRRREALAASDVRHQVRIASLMRSLNDVVFELSPDGIVEYATPSIERTLGWTVDAAVGRPVTTILPGVTAELRAQAEVCGESDPVRVEIALSLPDGRVAFGEVAGGPVPGRSEGTGTVWAWRDITERKGLEQRLEHQASHDSLTGLLNRDAFRHRVEAWHRLSNAPDLVALIVIDLDGFKAVNDTYGHHAGDVLLKGVADRVSRLVVGTGLVSRLGGDEFVVAIPCSVEGQAGQLANEIIEIIRMPVLANGSELRVGASLGIAYGDHTVLFDELMRRADQAMYDAKNLRGGRRRDDTPNPPLGHLAKTGWSPVSPAPGG